MGSGNTGGNWLDLADAIALLRDQIAEAQARIADPNGPGDKGVRFGLGEITVELGLELAETEGTNGGLRFGVFGFGANAGGKREGSDKATHRVTVRLDPRRSDGGPVEVRDRG